MFHDVPGDSKSCNYIYVFVLWSKHNYEVKQALLRKFKTMSEIFTTRINFGIRTLNINQDKHRFTAIFVIKSKTKVKN